METSCIYIMEADCPVLIHSRSFAVGAALFLLQRHQQEQKPSKAVQILGLFIQSELIPSMQHYLPCNRPKP
jgi:hypothetical protein